MSPCTISRAAELTGFTPSTLRFYEQQGLVVPDRASNGYRTYHHEHLEALRFVARAKTLGLDLDEIGDLVHLVGSEACGPVQSRLRELVMARAAAAEAQSVELSRLASQLRSTTRALGTHTPEGPCDVECGCTTEPPGGATPPVACTLGSGQYVDRLRDWAALVAQASTIHDLPDGCSLTFEPPVDLRQLTELIAEEHGCCAFLSFDLAITPGAVRLSITGPTEARDLIAELVGTAR